MSEDTRLRDFRPKTQEAYRRAVRQFLTYVKKEPAALVESDVRGYLIHLRDERMLSGSTRNVVMHGLRFFFYAYLPAGLAGAGPGPSKDRTKTTGGVES